MKDLGPYASSSFRYEQHDDDDDRHHHCLDRCEPLRDDRAHVVWEATVGRTERFIQAESFFLLYFPRREELEIRKKMA